MREVPENRRQLVFVSRTGGMTGQVQLVAAVDRVGGAARAAWRLFEGLREDGVDARMAVERMSSRHPAVVEISHSRALAARVRRAWRRRRAAREARIQSRSDQDDFELFTAAVSAEGAAIEGYLRQGDVVNLHWVAGMVDDEGLAALCRKRPVVWTLHDMHALTGGCHFDNGCGRFRDGCYSCPQRGGRGWTDRVAAAWNRKERTINTIDVNQLTLVSPSQWLETRASESRIFGRFRTVVIPYGLNVSLFRPHAREVARSILGLPGDAKIVCWAAGDVGARRKGFSVLQEALAALVGVMPVSLLFVGDAKRLSEMPFAVRATGRVDDEGLLALCYSAADLTVVPSLQDNLPNVVLESMACGTPVIGSNVGGIAEAIRDGESGRLVPPGDAVALAAVLYETLSSPEQAGEMGREARRKAETNWELRTQVQGYKRLFEELAARGRGQGQSRPSDVAPAP